MENPFVVEQPRKRSGFLTVLCILTFIGSGWSIISNTIELSSYKTSLERFEQSMSVFDALDDESSSFLDFFKSDSYEMMSILQENGFMIYSLLLLCSIFSVVGAIMMFNLKKKGFYIYVAANIVALLVKPIFIGFPITLLVGLGGNAIITILFIILYALNLKEMN